MGVLFWVAVAAAMMLPLLRRAPGGRPPAVLDELVKDPVCHTYVVRSRAVPGGRSAEPVYFCSTDCAQRYAGPVG